MVHEIKIFWWAYTKDGRDTDFDKDVNAEAERLYLYMQSQNKAPKSPKPINGKTYNFIFEQGKLDEGTVRLPGSEEEIVIKRRQIPINEREAEYPKTIK